jgi:CRP/FNR family cyclic AMP-dependent transcriptional regulator
MTLSKEQKRTLLSEHFLLRHMSEADLDALAEHTQIKSFAQDDVIFKRDDEAREMMVIVEGKVQISSPAKTSDKVICAALLPGDVFGEMSLIDGHTRSADATALEATDILCLERDSFVKLLENNARLNLDLLKVMSMRLRRTNELLEDFTILDLRRRLAKRLSYLSRDTSAAPSSGGMKMSVRISQGELIAMMGVTEDAIAKQLDLWDQNKLITIDRGWITVEDPDALKNIIEDSY